MIISGVHESCTPDNIYDDPVFTDTQTFKIFAEDLLSIARHLLHYIYSSIVTKESSQECLFSSKIKPHKILVHDEFLLVLPHPLLTMQ